MIITLTPKAAAEIRRLLAEPEHAGARGLRVTIDGGDGADRRHALALEEGPVDGEAVVESEGIRIWADATSSPHLDGVVIDFHVSGRVSGFTVDTTGPDGACGCGTSFTA